MKLILHTDAIEAIQPRLPPDIRVVYLDQDNQFEGDPSDAEVYLNWYYLRPTTLATVLAAAPNLRWQHTPSAGVNHILTPQYLSRKIILTNGSGIHAIPIAEFVLSYMLNHAKRLPMFAAFQTQSYWHQGWDEEVPVWQADEGLQELWDKTLLIIGAGSIGQAIAQRASAFGMRVWGSRRHPQPTIGFEKVVGADEWRSLLPFAKYVVVATPLTPSTRGLIDSSVLQSMRSDAYFINIARGAIVDEAALLTALQEKWIAGAALDTFATEPLPSDSPFWSLPNVVITPHCSALTARLTDRIVDLFLDNLTRYRSGQPLRNVVDQIAGY